MTYLQGGCFVCLFVCFCLCVVVWNPCFRVSVCVNRLQSSSSRISMIYVANMHIPRNLYIYVPLKYSVTSEIYFKQHITCTLRFDSRGYVMFVCREPTVNTWTSLTKVDWKWKWGGVRSLGFRKWAAGRPTRHHMLKYPILAGWYIVFKHMLFKRILVYI